MPCPARCRQARSRSPRFRFVAKDDQFPNYPGKTPGKPVPRGPPVRFNRTGGPLVPRGEKRGGEKVYPPGGTLITPNLGNPPGGKRGKNPFTGLGSPFPPPKL